LKQFGNIKTTAERTKHLDIPYHDAFRSLYEVDKKGNIKNWTKPELD